MKRDNVQFISGILNYKDDMHRIETEAVEMMKQQLEKNKVIVTNKLRKLPPFNKIPRPTLPEKLAWLQAFYVPYAYNLEFEMGTSEHPLLIHTRHGTCTDQVEAVFITGHPHEISRRVSEIVAEHRSNTERPTESFN